MYTYSLFQSHNWIFETSIETLPLKVKSKWDKADVTTRMNEVVEETRMREFDLIIGPP